VTFGKSDDPETDLNNTSVALFLLVLSSIWFGCSNAARDICGEWHIYQRERMYNLKLSSYTFSKLTINGLVCAIQCAVLIGIVTPFCGLDAPLAELYGIVFITALTGSALGLLVSAFSSPFAKRTEIAIGTTPLLLIPIVVLGGVIKPLKDMGTIAETAASTMISRWSFEGLLRLEAGERGEMEPKMLAELLDPEKAFTILETCGFMGALFVLFTTATLILLKRQDII